MPSGNAIYTYTGPEESTDIQGQVFLKDQPKHITDQGVIAVCAAREDFAESELGSDREKMVYAPRAAEMVEEILNPAKPKKAKSK